MAYCSHCGNFVDDSAQFCGSCGASRAAAQQPAYQQPQQQTYQTYQQPQQNYYQPQQTVSKKSSVLSLVFGGVALFCGIMSVYIMALIGFFFLAAAIVFIILAKKQRNNYVRQAGCDNGLSRAGNILSIVAIPVTIVFALVGLLYLALVGSYLL